MSHKHLDGAHTHGATGSGSVDLDAIGQLIVILALSVVAIDVVMWLLHILVIIATAIGFAVMGGAAGYIWYKIHQIRTRRRYPYPPPGWYPPGVYPQPYAAQMPPPPAYPQQQAIAPPGGDIHLHLPDGITADQLGQILSRPADGRELPPRDLRRWS
jgi:hypothetical protein